MAAADKDSKKDDVEEDDEDYNPDEDMQDDDEDVPNASVGADSMFANNGIPPCMLPESKRRAVDAAFEELFGYSFGTRFLPKRRKLGDDPSNYNRTEDIIVAIFGPTAAAQIMATSNTVTKMKVQRAPLPSRILTTVTEEKKYAGQTIRVTRTLNATQAAAAAAATTTAEDGNPKGLDSLLQALNGPGKLSTVAKTSADWDTFKTDAGVEDELDKQAQGKNAYLHKQDFLKRVDERRFVDEKTKRDQERSKRGK
mmetsp:Transcript_13919/g.23119  ORF Transcript_13919/g.23119 Transcript_13919/m.23119 type:complete len:254 (+) Transcript_13919:92-853(+)|eukprot:CAMPEP_0119013530 /NCGR_PEP_ID=MMETSP1176-20130426/8498_1 /TAXON_ID=265551 /ORGANISM="Synedropsis recta cf, Strain CCMP1620" /LENGTH=253 /DNA_ID=CAMNT_0006966627 /DNA_START=92 /DNA_END=853 /DNA_ORIENTATION=-